MGSSYGMGQGFSKGVQMAGSFILPAVGQQMQDKRARDQMALNAGWMQGWYQDEAPAASEQEETGSAGEIQMGNLRVPGRQLSTAPAGARNLIPPYRSSRLPFGR